MAETPALDLTWRAGPDAQALCDLLYAALDDYTPIAIHEHDSGDGWRVFFRNVDLRNGALDAIRALSADGLTSISPASVADEGWARRSQANLHAVRIGRFVVTPPWDRAATAPPDPGDLIVVIDPSTGFGTGHHETTRLCLRLLQTLDVSGRRVIDVGTGSGVLAIAAAKLGASPVIGVDDDPEALRNAAENIDANDVTNAVSLEQADLGEFESGAAPLVLANLTAAVLVRYADRLRPLVDAGGALIVSGFSGGELDGVADAFGWTIDSRLDEADWTAAMLRPSTGGHPTRS